jgi:glycerophosphoryl diester phosphodiesterase
LEDLSWLTSRPIAHRGLFDADRPENSMAAFRNAVTRGIPFELDVQRARDGTLVVIHDPDLVRLAGQRLAVSDLDRDQLRGLRIGSSGESIPVLSQVLEEVNGQVPILVDVRRWHAERSPDLEQAVAAEVRDYRGPLALQSFDPLAVLRLRRLVRDRPVGQITGELASAGQILSALGRTMVTNLLTRPHFASYGLAALPSRPAAFWRRHMPLITWTVKSSADEEQAAKVADNFLFDGYLPTAYQ